MTQVEPSTAETVVRIPPRRGTGDPCHWIASHLDGLVLAVVALLGLLKVAFPFTGDQAMFTVGARSMRHGAVLYGGFWDIKQPAIYVFYLLAGMVGGYNEVSVHALELVTLLGFSSALQRAGRRLFEPRWVASLLPLFVVGLYYASARPWELTQLEAFVGIPLFASVWCALRSVDAGHRKRQALLAAAGFAAAVAALLKIVCLPLAVPAWIVAVALHGRTTTARGLVGRARAALHDLVWIGLGVAAPLAATATYFAAHGLLHEVTWTYFTYTPKTTGIAGRPLSRLTDAVGRFGAVWAPVLLLGGLGVARNVRRGWDRFAVAFAGWIAVGVPVWLTQHWWPYQLQMFLVPLGFFAARGVQELALRWRTLPRGRTIATWAVVVVAAVPLAVSAGGWTARAASHGFGLSGSERIALHETGESQYATARQFARFVAKNDPGAGAVYVLGNPIDLYVSGRAQAIPANGWEAEQYDQTLWHRIAGGLRHARPGVLVVDDFSAAKVRERSPETRAVIREMYCPARRVGSEVWYLLQGACPTSTGPNV